MGFSLRFKQVSLDSEKIDNIQLYLNENEVQLLLFFKKNGGGHLGGSVG